MRILITGANGHLGRRLIRRLNDHVADADIYALVRSERARQQLLDDDLKANISIVDYGDAEALSEIGRATGPLDVVVHLVGIIKESEANPFEKAHEGACRALVESGIETRQIVSLGILGTSDCSDNACLQSRARADQILLDAPTPATILRVPMVLGPEDYASLALARNAGKSMVFSFRAGSLEQPIDSRDVIEAILAASALPADNRVIELAGPQSLSRRALIQQAGALVSNSPRVVSLPVAVGYAIAWVMEKFSANPPVTRAMLGVLDHDDCIDITEAVELLGLKMTPFEKTLQMVISNSRSD